MGRFSPYMRRFSPLVLVVLVLAFAARTMTMNRDDGAVPELGNEPMVQAAGFAPVRSPIVQVAQTTTQLAPSDAIVTFLRRAPVIDANAQDPHGGTKPGPCQNCHRIRPPRPNGGGGTAIRFTNPERLTITPLGAAAALRTTPVAPQVFQARVPAMAVPAAVPMAPARPAPRRTELAPALAATPTIPGVEPTKAWDWTAATTAGRPGGKVLPFMEGHWQGLEVLPLWPTLAVALGIPTTTKGVLVDEITQPADGQGFAAGDVVVTIGGVATPTVEAFLLAASGVRDGASVELGLVRNGVPMRVVLTALPLGNVTRLGTANGETAPMIPPGIPRPHAYIGPCTNCHRIGTVGSIPIDPGTLFPLTAPPIKAGAKITHADRGPCVTCHTIQ